MNLSHNNITHKKARVERYSYHRYDEDYEPQYDYKWYPRKWFDVLVGTVCIAGCIAAFCAVIFGFGAGIYAISENTCEHKAHKYGVEGWSYGLATGCNYKVDGKWIDSGKYPETFVKVQR